MALSTNYLAGQEIVAVVFPANGDVGIRSRARRCECQARSPKNGVKHSNGNRAIRHRGVPTVSATMGLMAEKKMPCNLTFAGKHGQDCELLQFARAFEQATASRARLPVTPELPTDAVGAAGAKDFNDFGGYAPLKLSIMDSYVEGRTLHMSGNLNTSYGGADTELQVFVDGKPASPVKESFAWSVAANVKPLTPEIPLYGGYSLHVGRVDVLVVARGEGGVTGEVLSVTL